MKTFSCHLIAVLLLATANFAYGDLRPAGQPGATSADEFAVDSRFVGSTPTRQPVESHNALAGSTIAYSADVLSVDVTGIAPLSSTPLINEEIAQPTGFGNHEIKSLPPLPGSASLFLSAVLSVGAWHLIRSTAHLQFGNLPDWYHTGAPVQIGHTVVYDFFNDLPLCYSQEPLSEQPIFLSHWSEHRSRCDSQSFLTCIDLRGPPALS